jgi:hypothetical protein
MSFWAEPTWAIAKSGFSFARQEVSNGYTDQEERNIMEACHQ